VCIQLRLGGVTHPLSTTPARIVIAGSATG
jgi:hypothetical protein